MYMCYSESLKFKGPDLVSISLVGLGLFVADICNCSGCLGRPRSPSPPRPQCQLVAMASGKWRGWVSFKLPWQESNAQGHSAGGSHSPSW